MKKFIFIVAALLSSNISSYAEEAAKDSIKQFDLQEVLVVATRATRTTPVAFTNVTNQQIKQTNFGQDIPYLLSMTPSAVTTSDAGAGVGYTTLRVRGTDATRINITANGIPMNDAESHCLYWVNMPDFASSVQNIQVQRGAGTSTNGAGAFGASVNFLTESVPFQPFTEINGSYGSFNTHKETVKFGTGLLKDHWAFEARLSNIGSDGYIDRAFSKLNSYFVQGGYFTDDMSLRFITFTGKEETYHAWNYASKEEMEEHGRRYNSCGKYKDDKGNTAYYDNQTDNYTQKNYQLIFNKTFSPSLSLNAALHYTRGDGYYEEYKKDQKFYKYGLSSFTIDGTTTEASDLIRRKMMGNDFYGGVFSLAFTKNRLAAYLGGGLNYYDGDHFGKLMWIKNYIGALSPEQEYYRNNAKKRDGNVYLKANYNFTRAFSLYADIQYRNINYKIKGVNDNYDSNINAMQALDINHNFNFFNPKVGLNWQLNNQNRLYASFSVAQKEPTRNNYTDRTYIVAPKAEKLNDYELGYNFTSKYFTAGANLYYMDYKDQLVLTGELNKIGEAISDNVPNSYRSGIELMMGIQPVNWFNWNVNATFSRNRIKDFQETLYTWDQTDPIVINHGDTHIAYSPDIIVNNQFAVNYKGFNAALTSQYVSKQYMNNANIEEITLDAYFVSNLNLAYTFKLPSIKSVTVGFTIYNLFNEEYENNGYTESAYELSDPTHTRENYVGYAAQAGINVLGNISFRF